MSVRGTYCMRDLKYTGIKQVYLQLSSSRFSLHDQRELLAQELSRVSSGLQPLGEQPLELVLVS